MQLCGLWQNTSLLSQWKGVSHKGPRFNQQVQEGIGLRARKVQFSLLCHHHTNLDSECEWSWTWHPKDESKNMHFCFWGKRGLNKNLCQHRSISNVESGRLAHIVFFSASSADTHVYVEIVDLSIMETSVNRLFPKKDLPFRVCSKQGKASWTIHYPSLQNSLLEDPDSGHIACLTKEIGNRHLKNELQFREISFSSKALLGAHDFSHSWWL